MKDSKKRAFPLWRRGAFLFLVALAALFIAHGIELLDVEEILTNASILCLSCIGIG